jgi:hypothetical protein
MQLSVVLQSLAAAVQPVSTFAAGCILGSDITLTLLL